MDDNQLLIRHAEKWAAGRGRVLETDVLGVALNLRAMHDGLAANRWPTRSVEHLMLVRWPSHGPKDPPDIPTLVSTLDSFWRFLRGTGRMAGASADPASLLKEARAAARRMRAACADRANWSQSKQLIGFGEEVGISLDDAADVDEVNARMQQIMSAWNTLPEDVRRSRMPSVGNVGSRMGRAPTDAMATYQQTGGLPEDWRLPAPPRLDDEDGEEAVFPNAPEVSAPQVRSCGFVQKVLELAEWVGSGRETTEIGVLRPAVAQEAYDTLDLWTWEREWARANGSMIPDTPEGEALMARTYQVWRSAADCLPLDRLWRSAVAAGLITIAGKRATRNTDALPHGDDEWVVLGHELLLALIGNAQRRLAFDPLLGTLFAISARVGEPSTTAELRDVWWNSPRNDVAQALQGDPIGREFSDRTLDRCLVMFGDCGLWILRHDHLVGTAFGWDFALMLINAYEDGLIEE